MAHIDTWPVQVAVKAALAGANVCGGRIFDDAPPDVAFPYVEVGEAIDAEDDNSLSFGVAQVLTLRVWSRYRGHKETKEQVALIRTVLHQTSLVVPGLSSCISYVDGVTHLDDPDGLTRQATVRVRLHPRE